MTTGKQFAEEALKIFAMNPKAGYIWGTKGVLWTEKRQANLEKTTDENRASGRKYGKKWIGHYVWDCSGLTSYCGAKFGIKYHHGSNSSFLYDCQAKGKLTKGLDLPKGAFVYTGTDDKKPHIGIYTGDGMVTEAAGTIQGVIQTKLFGGKWKYWGLGKNIRFDFMPGKGASETEASKPTPIKYPTLRRGDRGELVTQLQDLLSKDGYKLAVDGIFGPGTQSCVRAFQKKTGITVDGIVGPQTWGQLLKVR